ncbi:MAG: hypothetical protein ABII71_03390 [Candidatus Micrarchaeota archaeon]
MSAIRNLFVGMFVLLMLVPTVSADLFGGSDFFEGQLVVMPTGEGSNVLEASLLLFRTEASAVDFSETQRIAECCRGEGYHEYCDAAEFIREDGGYDWQSCIHSASAERLGSTEQDVTYMTVPNANFTFLYWSPNARDWVGIPDCSPVLTAEDYRTVGEGADAIPYYYVSCEVPTSLYSTGGELGGTGRINVKVVAPAQLNGGITTTPYTTTLTTEDTSPGILPELTDMITSLVAGPSGIGGTLPCLGIFMILGLLLASMYFSGKSPISLLDITTPRLPAPKGVSASGQILAPFGYTEMKRTLKSNMGLAAGATALTSERLATRGAGVTPSEVSEIRRLAQAAPATAGDRAAGDVGQLRQMSESMAVAARRAGMSAEEARSLARRLPYHYGEEEHRVVSQLMSTLEGRGGQDAVLGGSIRQYISGLSTWKRLEVLTAHPELGVRSAAHQRVQSALGKAFGRYAILGPIVAGTVDSMSRTTQVVARGTRAAGTHGIAFAREMAKTGTTAVVGGKPAFEARAAAAQRRGGAAGAFYKQVTTPPHEMVVGGMYRVDQNMGFFYGKLRHELTRDEMRHVVSRIYGKAGVNVHMTQEELANIGCRDLDVVKMSGVRSSAAFAAMEEEIRHILGNTKASGEQKLGQLLNLAERQGIARSEFSGMLQFQRSVEAVEASKMPEFAKMLALQQVIEQHHNDFPPGSASSPNAFHSFVGREHMTAQEIWNMSVFRSMVYANEEGHVYGAGIKEALQSEWLKAVNRMVTLNPASNMHELPEYMRNEVQLGKIRDRARGYFADMFTAEGREMFQKVKGKSVSQAAIAEMVDFTFGGAIPKSGMTPDGRRVWHQGAFELAPPTGAFKTDMKTHWLSHIDTSENIAMAPWINRRFGGGYVTALDPSVEARLDRAVGSTSWSVDQRRTKAQQMWVSDYIEKDMRNRANSTFCNHAYGGQMHETTGFYNNVLAAFMEKALKENKGMPGNHADLRFLETMKMQNPEDLKKFRTLAMEHQDDLKKVLGSKITYDDLAGFKQPWVLMSDGGYCPYRHAMPVGDKDRMLAGEVSLYNRETKSHMLFNPDDVNIHFGGRSDLERRWQDLQSKRTTHEWNAFMNEVTAWAKDGGYSYEKQKILGAVTWRYGNQTYDYGKFWNNSDVKVMAKREVMPLAPSIFRMFNWEAPGLMKAIKPFRDMALHVGDYVSRVALSAGGELHKASWEITPYSEFYRQASWRNAQRIMSADLNQLGLSAQEQKAYRRLAIDQGRFDQVWAFAIDRNPWLASSSFGTHQAWAAKFHFGPQDTYSLSNNLQSYMTKSEYMNFMAHSGAVISVARRMMAPYTNMFRGMQMSMQGYASKFDSVNDPLRQYNFTQPRVLEALQSLNPFSASIGRGRLAQALNKSNVFQSSLEARQLAGNDFRGGLGAAAQDMWLQNEGVYSDVRIGAANPGLSAYSYRANLRLDPTMAANMLRSGDASVLFEKEIQDSALDTHHRRTISAEALQIRRGQEMRGFGVSQNSMFGWANPLLFMWHMPAPGTGSFGLRNITTSLVDFVKNGHRGGGYMNRLADTADRTGAALGRAMRPWRMSSVCYCANCGRAGYRGATCSNANCRSRLY